MKDIKDFEEIEGVEEDKDLFDALMKEANDEFDAMDEEEIEEGVFPMIAAPDGSVNEDMFYSKIKEELPILTLRNMILYPKSVLPVTVGR